MSIILVACIDMDFGIGDIDGDLLYNLPKDMEHFKSITTGKHVVMGRKTWESLPNKPLPKRKNYILTRDKSFKVDGAKVLNSIEDVLELSRGRNIYIIGGEEVYHQFMPYADEMMLTHVHHVNQRATSFFPDYDDEDWKPVSLLKNEADEKHRYSFTFANYVRATPKKVAIDKDKNN